MPCRERTCVQEQKHTLLPENIVCRKNLFFANGVVLFFVIFAKLSVFFQRKNLKFSLYISTKRKVITNTVFDHPTKLFLIMCTNECFNLSWN